MNSLDDIFKAFCNYVDERIFPEENSGTYVAFVVDQAFIDDFCKIHSISESLLMSAVRESLRSYRRDCLYVKGILAIQLFAASKRVNDGYITDKNYRDRLSLVLNWYMYDLQDWMKKYQDDIWESFYDWCDRHYFQITKCERRTGTGRYVQYPVNQALRVFTDEDLMHIACCFVDKKISPGEDLQKIDFEKIIGKYDIQHNIQTKHGWLVIENSISDEDYYNQVYNYFLRWNGEYKEKIGKVNSVIKKGTEQLYLYLPDDFQFLEMRTANLILKKKFDLSSTSYATLAKDYSFKRNGVVLFKRDDVYDNYWQEVRFLEDKEKEGLVMCFYQKETAVDYRLRQSLIFHNKYIQIFRIQYGCNTRDFYTEARFYELHGGLKVGRQAYLQGATPTLKLERPTRLWIDGKAYGEGECEGEISLSHLAEGHHYIKIQDFKKLEFDILEPLVSMRVWMNDYYQWQIDKGQAMWDSCKCERGIVGLDFSSIPAHKTFVDIPPLKRWTNLLTYGKSYENETNVTLQIIKEVEL